MRGGHMSGAEEHPPAWCMAAWPIANWSVRPSWSTPVACSVCCICVYEKGMRQSSGLAGVSNVRATVAIARQGKAKNARFSHLSKNHLLSAPEKVLSRCGGAAACPTFLYWKMRTGYKQAFFNAARARNAPAPSGCAENRPQAITRAANGENPIGKFCEAVWLPHTERQRQCV